MRIGILGTGIVGQTLGTKLVSLGNEVTLGRPLVMGALKSPNFNFIVSRADG